MSEWLIRLKGHAADLRVLASLDPKEWAVVERQGSFYLGSSQFVSLTESEDVRRSAAKLLVSINGATLLDRDDFQPVELDHVIRIRGDGGEDVFISVSDTLHVYLRAYVEVNGETPATPSNVEPWVDLADCDAKVAEVFGILDSRNLDPMTLYNIYQIIGSDVNGKKGIVTKGWASRNQLNRFTRTVNHPAASGRDARHPRLDTEPPPHPMSLEEARSFIRTIIQRWLRWKCSHGRQDLYPG